MFSTDCLSKNPEGSVCWQIYDTRPKRQPHIQHFYMKSSSACSNTKLLLQDCNLEGSPRHSLGSNNSSNLSTPPSPVREMGSSSYESWTVREIQSLMCWSSTEANISWAKVFRHLEKWGIWTRGVRLREICAVGLWGFHIQIQFHLNFLLDSIEFCIPPNFALIFTTCIAFWDRAIL